MAPSAAAAPVTKANEKPVTKEAVAKGDAAKAAPTKADPAKPGEATKADPAKKEPDATKKEAPGPTSGRRTDHDILVAIAANLKPSGFFVLGDEPTLVFGQKRVKAGGTVSIRFEDTDYTLEIVSIELPNFTLRLNREEFTRPIK